MPDSPRSHDEAIVEQFTLQAEPFAGSPALSDAAVLGQIVEAIGLLPDDAVLDVACGPGLVACALARVARHVTGIDLTPTMIEKAEALQRAQGLTNLTWQVGSALSLPYPDGSFAVVCTRYSFHHLLDPRAALAEMVRVCRPSGKIAVVDVYTTSAQQASAYDRFERLRDPSHVRALGLDELHSLFRSAGLEVVREGFYRLGVELEQVLARAFTTPAALTEIRTIFAEDVGKDRLGVGAQRRDNRIHFSYPTVILIGRKPP